MAELWAKIKSLLGEKVVMEKVYEVTTTANMPQIDIPLPNPYNYSRLEISMRLLGTAANADFVHLRLNGLSTGYYLRNATTGSAAPSDSLGVVYAPGPYTSNGGVVRCVLNLTTEPTAGQACILAEVAAFTRWGGMPFFDWILSGFLINTLGAVSSFNLVPQSGKPFAAGCEIIIYGVRR